MPPSRPPLAQRADVTSTEELVPTDSGSPCPSPAFSGRSQYFDAASNLADSDSETSEASFFFYDPLKDSQTWESHCLKSEHTTRVEAFVLSALHWCLYLAGAMLGSLEALLAVVLPLYRGGVVRRAGKGIRPVAA